MGEVSQVEVVITGMGVVCPIGIGTEAFQASLAEGRSGVGPITLLDNGRLPVPFGAEVPDFEPKKFVRPRKSLKVMVREIQIAFAAAELAMERAGLQRGAGDPDRMGVVFGSDMIYSDFGELAPAYRNCIDEKGFRYERWGDRAMNDIPPLWMLKYLPNMPACHIGIAQDARGPNNSITLGEVSSLLAVAEGTSVIQRGQADMMIVGGTGSRLHITGLLWRGDIRLSHRLDAPTAACRPFDAGRDGEVNGEGSGAFVLERRDHAEARGAEILARVLGYGSRYEARLNGRTGNGDATRNAIRESLRMAGVEAADVGHVNANGFGTIQDDPLEAKAIRDVLGDVPVTALKSFFGNLGAGGGAVEMAASILSFATGEVPITLNYEQPDPECPVNVVHGTPHAADKPIAVMLNQNTAGQSAAVVLAGP